jgi:hypothetical protein
LTDAPLERPDGMAEGGSQMDLAIADIAVVLFITIGPMKAAIVFATLTAKGGRRLPATGRDQDGDDRGHRRAALHRRRRVTRAPSTIPAA